MKITEFNLNNRPRLKRFYFHLFLTFFFIIIVSLLLIVNYFYTFSMIPLTSENAMPALVAKLFIENPTSLHEWVFPPDNFLFLDSLLSLITNCLVGFGPASVRLSSIIIFYMSVFMAVSTMVLIGNKNNIARYIIVILAFFGLPLSSDKSLITFAEYTPDHLSTVIVTLVCFLLAANIISKEAIISRSFDYFIYIILSLSIYISDRLSFFICLVPIFLVIIINKPSKRAFAFLTVTIGIAIISFLIIKENLLFTTINIPSRFVTYALFYENIKHEIYYLTLLFGADFWGQRVNPITLTSALRMALFIPTIYYLYALGKTIFSLKNNQMYAGSYNYRKNIFFQLLLLSIIIDIMATLFSNVFYLYGSYSNSDIRYIFPIIYFGAILVGLNYRSKHLDYFFLVILVTTALCNMSSVEKTYTDYSYNYTSICNVIESHGYKYGFAPYWYGNILTLTSKGKLLVEPISFSGNKLPIKISGFDGKLNAVWNSNIAMFNNIKARKFFFVTDTGSVGDITTSQVEAVFGHPKELVDVPGAKILFYVLQSGS